MPADPALAKAEAVSVSVVVDVLTLAAGVMELSDHVAVTPEGNPLTAKPMDPANEPPVAAVKFTTPELPTTRGTKLEAAVSLRVGAWSTVRA
jgi:hypothetical protein